jgi:ABC-type antimicrobial peptide transport system permease subunit
MNKRYASMLMGFFFSVAVTASAQFVSVSRYPTDKATGVNPDTHLVLTFPSVATLGKSGRGRFNQFTVLNTCFHNAGRACSTIGLIAAAVTASYLPARRAAAVNPVQALRSE